jgi:hypothetical protein
VDPRQPTSTNTLSVVALSEKTVDTTNGERKTGLGRSAIEWLAKAQRSRDAIDATCARREKDASKAAKIPRQRGGNREATHDCAFLEPLAFPPDLPPVILREVGLVD